VIWIYKFKGARFSKRDRFLLLILEQIYKIWK
jgi:hypothetical protein